MSRRPLILRSLARTNVVKRDAEEWIGRIDEGVLERQTKSERDESLEGSRLISKYNEIVSQYNMKLRN